MKHITTEELKHLSLTEGLKSTLLSPYIFAGISFDYGVMRPRPMLKL